MKIRSFLSLALFMPLALFAQQKEDKLMLNHMDVAVDVSSMGFGLELSAPVGKYVSVRAGLDAMPSIKKEVNFGVQVGDDPATSQSKFDRLSEILSSITGQKIDDNVDMVGDASFVNFKFLVDVFPFQKHKEWHVTAGFYWGSSQVAKAYNTTEDMPTLFSVGMYNFFYDRTMSGYYEDYDLFDGFPVPPAYLDMLYDKFGRYGRMGMHIGDYSHDGPQMKDAEGNPMVDAEGNPVLMYHKGDHYIMEPDGDRMVKAKIRTNSFKPYLGVGYAKSIGRPNSGWGLAVDAGVLFWGGAPSIVTHDGTDLAKDLCNVKGKVGRYVDLVKGFTVYPVVQLRLTKTIL